MTEKRLTPMDYEYSKYFLKNATLLRSSLSDFFFFDGEEAFEREFGRYQEVVEDIIKRATQLKEGYKKKESDVK